MSTDRREWKRSVGRGLLAGAAAFVLGYVLTYAWKAPAVSDAVRGINFVAELLGSAAIPTWKAVAWLFYGEHFVATLFPTFGGDTMVNLVDQGEGTTVLYLLPPVLLVVAGAVAGSAGSSDELRDAVARGAATVFGYLPLVVIGAVATSHAIAGGGRSIAPDLITAILLAGVVYPLAFGGIGGALASRR